MKQYIDLLARWFPVMAYANTNVIAMCKNWESQGVELEDIRGARDGLIAQGKEIKSPMYLQFPVLTFAKYRREMKSYLKAQERFRESYEKPKNEGDVRLERLLRGEGD